MNENDYLAGLSNKTVALVGAAASATGLRKRAEIEGHDLVVRVNWSCPVPRAMRKHIGVRTDILYHVLRFAKRRMTGGDVENLLTANVGTVVSVHPEQRKQVQNFMALNRERIPLVCFESFRADLVALTGTVPNTGVFAMAHLLSSDLKVLRVYGFDFYKTGHFLGQRNETPEQAAAQQGIVTGHNQKKIRTYVKWLDETDNRLILTPRVHQALYEE